MTPHLSEITPPPTPTMMLTESPHIVCPHCLTTNRVKQGELTRAPDCGQCKQPLFNGRPVTLATEDAFTRHTSRNHKGRLSNL